MLIKNFLFKYLNLKKIVNSLTKNKKKYIFVNKPIKILKFKKFISISYKNFQKIILLHLY
jgi:hypothetical protein